MNRKILLVDDEPNLLLAYRRSLRTAFEVATAQCGEHALSTIETIGPFAVVVADNRMPNMGGVDLLSRVHAIAPQTVRMMLTGHVDQQTAIDAINKGSIFRFLTKPCNPDDLSRALEDGVQQYQLVTAEAELLNRTLSGAVSMMVDLLSQANPEGFGRATKLRACVREYYKVERPGDAWQVELAAMLGAVCQISLPTETVMKARTGSDMTEAERQAMNEAAKIGRDLVSRIPRLEGVGDLIYYQSKNYDGSGYPDASVTSDMIPDGARLLKVLGDLVAMEERGTSRSVAIRTMRGRHGWYDPDVLDAVAERLCNAPVMRVA